MDVEILGTRALQIRLAENVAKAPTALGSALYVEAEAIMKDSKELVPVDTGVLRASGHVELPSIDGQGVKVEMGYGGAAERYALIQHERLDYNHPNGQAKFLEQPVLEHAQGMAERLGASVKRWLER